MTTVRESRGGLLGFLTTMPGIITAFAGLISAVGTVVGVSLANSDGSDPPEPNVVVVPQPAPDRPTDDEIADVDVPVDTDTGLSTDDPDQVMLDNCALGDLEACAAVLGTLSQECYSGYGISCDVLYLVSPMGSDYEWYGGTCGGYFDDLSYAGICSEL